MNLASRGVEVRQVGTRMGQIDLDELNDACDSRTRIIAVSWVAYASGWRNDLAALADVAHRNGALLFVDAIQGLGVFPLDVSQVPIDFLAADGHKWLLGPEGAGVLFVRREHLDLLRPLGVGWNSVKHSHDYSNTNMILKETAGRYEGGSYNTVGFVALAASLDLLARYPVEDISRRVLELGDLACRRLEEIGAKIASSRDRAHASGIISFTLDYDEPGRLKRLCKERGVVLNFRDGRLRVSPHAYNNEEDVERLIEALVAVTSA
jgi:selenocysteine lyase/cysteine desulfurase